MSRLMHLGLTAGLLMGAAAFTAPTDAAKKTEQVERHLSPDQMFQQWAQDPNLLALERGDRLELRQVPAEELDTVKLKNVVPPIHFESGVAKIPQEYVDTLARILESMRYRRNVRQHLVGHADSQRLSEPLVKVFGDNAGLSRERAGEVAENLSGSAWPAGPERESRAAVRSRITAPTCGPRRASARRRSPWRAPPSASSCATG